MSATEANHILDTVDGVTRCCGRDENLRDEFGSESSRVIGTLAVHHPADCPSVVTI
jgi:hypothetical protein